MNTTPRPFVANISVAPIFAYQSNEFATEVTEHTETEKAKQACQEKAKQACFLSIFPLPLCALCPLWLSLFE
jgi:hypothetical protein